MTRRLRLVGDAEVVEAPGCGPGSTRFESAPSPQPRPSTGKLRFCCEGCHDGYQEDCRHGLLTLPRDFAAQGYCMYCGAAVATNEEKRRFTNKRVHGIGCMGDTAADTAERHHNERNGIQPCRTST